jgi:serine phosphatase RsbU (regulator of sigma subunit)/ligand-binding sensor domain-containing protein
MTKISRLFIISIAIFLLFPYSFSAQNKIKFNNYSTIDGLSNSTIQRIYQDNFGYIWLGTNDGLNKYDGYNFQVYRDDPDNENSIMGNLILEIYEDSKKNLWIGTELALNKYNRDTDSFINYQFDASQAQPFFNAVLACLEDSKGDFWIGKAFHGLTKFNRETETFERFLIDSVQVGDRTKAIFEIVEDNEGKLWIGEGNNFNSGINLSILNAEKDKFYSIYDTLKSLTGIDQFTAVIGHFDGKVYFNSQQGYSIEVDVKTFDFKKIKVSDKYPVFMTIKDEKDNLWFAVPGEGVVKYNPQNDSKIVYSHDPNDNTSISNNGVINLYQDATGVFWVGTEINGFAKFDPTSIMFTNYSMKMPDSNNPESVTSFSISEYYYPKIWVASLMGFQLFNPETNTIEEKITKIPELTNVQVRSIVEKDGILWLGTWGKGLFKVDLNTWNYTVHISEPRNSKKLISDFVRTLYFDSKNSLWVGNDVGLHRMKEDQLSFDRFKYLDTSYTPGFWSKIQELQSSGTAIAEIKKVGNDANISKPFEISQPTNALVVSIGESFFLQDGQLWDYGWIEDESRNKIWVYDSLNSMHAGGDVKNRISADVLKFDPGKYFLRYKSDDSHSYEEWNASGTIVPEFWGIQLYPLEESEADFIEKKLLQKSTGSTIPGDNIRALYDDGNGKLWIGTNNSGFGYYDYNKDSFVHFGSGSRGVTNFSTDRINSFLKDDNDNLWIASFGGLLKFDYSSNSVKKLKNIFGLKTNYLQDLIQDQHGDIWISTLNGLAKFNPNSDNEVYTFNTFDISDGLQDINFIQGSSIKLEDGRILFGGTKGFTSFFPEDENQFPPKIVINQLYISNEEISLQSEKTPLTHSIAMTDSLELTHKQNDFAFEFTAIHYSRPEKNQYAYMLEGFDEEWIYDNRRYASYTNLDAGEYIFKVKAANSNGIWTSDPHSIKINILPPWWKTTLAYIVYVFVFISIIFSLDRLQRKRILTKERERQKIQEAELRAVAAEAQARVIQAENDRQTKELEEARKLQLSMLPSKLPEIPNIDIAVYMSTATEVGGDYYDFHIGIDGTLTVVVGDATGHGLNAGTIVTATKSLFSTHAANNDIIYTFSEISRCLKEMRLRLLSMCLTILKIKDYELTLSAAGMPPGLILRNNGDFEELLIKGMPLGSPATFPYEVKQTKLEKGDTLLLMSDGFPELFNEENEMLGYKEVYNTFKLSGHKSAEEIIEDLKTKGDKWKGSREQDDDITFVVLKIR